jgi:transposase
MAKDYPMPLFPEPGDSTVDMRELKGLELAARARISFADGVWSVPSQTSPTTKYRATLDPATCTCEDWILRREPCKHIHAARLTCERDYGGKAPAIDTTVVPVRPTYRQNWTAYNLAQREEKHRFQVLLHDLCAGLPSLPYKFGRPRTPTSDAVFAMVFKIYSTVSSRRFSCDLKDARERGHLSKDLHYNSINTFLETAGFTPILKSLIVRSSLPLKSVETTFAVDSTGFSTSRFVRWYDQKYGVTRQEHDWVKVHVATGVKTNVVTAVEILGRNAADSPLFVSLLNKTAETFTVNEVSADKGYLSVENIEAVFAAGGTPFIAFKVNSTEGDGGLWGKMFHFYSFNRDEFLRHYHKRSNVESTFMMVKTEFRDHVRSKTDAAMVNEVLCKLIAHNLCVVIQSQCELGIEATFWNDKPSDFPAILPMLRPG